LNFSNHYRHLSDEYLLMIAMSQADHGGYRLATKGYVTMSELADIGNMMLMGWEMNL